MRDLHGRRGLVTGATGGLGHAIARALASERVELVLSGRNEQRLGELARELGARSIRADLTDGSQVESLAEQAGAVDILVNNAGIELYGSFGDVERDVVERIVTLNLTAPMLLTHRLLPGMLERGRGHVVNIASLAGHACPPYQAPYATTKAGLIALTRALAAEYRATPVGFSVVSPSFVTDAGMHAEFVEARGVETPVFAGTVKPEAVARAVLRAIRDDRLEVLVAPRPVRPLVALAGLSPRLAEGVLRRTGVGAMFHAAAETHRGTPTR
jgi:short-subunit dehydrogenase